MSSRKAWPGKPSPEQLEKYLTWLDGGRLWLSKAYRIGVRMVQGAYLLDERRKLLTRLGEKAFAKVKSGEWSEGPAGTTETQTIHQLVHQIDRLDKKLELEEQLIRELRFGNLDPDVPGRRPPTAPGADGEMP